jgi:hypothetical protein
MKAVSSKDSVSIPTDHFPQPSAFCLLEGVLLLFLLSQDMS